ncbi:Uncharacterised protein [Budvicia aquatica]|uniref:Uncharacterized protein n=1 Tax=Budvicia aquatica TaxID=82979 RepID=A0A484ZIL3_9GAMM|nr:Uncharacterised protein [Budvicia aquatica]
MVLGYLYRYKNELKITAKGNAMLSILRPKVATHKVPDDQIQSTYNRYRVQALFSVFIGYLSLLYC